jgi:hypothetical protein
MAFFGSGSVRFPERVHPQDYNSSVMWSHFVSLLRQSGQSFLAALGTTGLGWWVQGIIWFAATEFATYGVIWVIRGKAAMKAHLAENFRIGFYVWLIVMVCIYGPIFGWHVVKAVYEDHETLISNIDRLENAPKPTCPTCPNCPTPKACGGDADTKAARRVIQERLAKLMNEGIILRSRWTQVMGQPEDSQRAVARDVPYWHAKIENYIRTLPRSDVYLVRLNSAHRGDFGYPIGINISMGGNWDTLLIDLGSLKELMDDPDFGKP